MSGLKTFRSRVNTVMRRPSSAFSLPRSSTPPVKSDAASDTASINQPSQAQPSSPKLQASQARDSSPSLRSKTSGELRPLDTASEALPPPHRLLQAVMAPSPIAESPAREAAAVEADANQSRPQHSEGRPLGFVDSIEDSIALEGLPSNSVEPDAIRGSETEQPVQFVAEPEEVEALPSEGGVQPVQDQQMMAHDAHLGNPWVPYALLPPQAAVEDSYVDVGAVTSPPKDDNIQAADAAPELPAGTVAEEAESRSLKSELSKPSSTGNIAAPSPRSHYVPHAPPKLSARPSKTSMYGSLWDGNDKTEYERLAESAPVPAFPSNSRAPQWGFNDDLQIPSVDPFADHAAEDSGRDAVMPSQETPSHRGSYVRMPLPQIHDVIPSRPARNSFSAYSLGNGSNQPVERETNETRPLLARPSSPQPYIRPSTSTSLHSPHPSTAQVSTALLRSFGWLEYVLPDGTSYYVHPTQRVTTDINLRSQKCLKLVADHLEGGSGTERGKSAGKGWEVWLKDVATTGAARRGKLRLIRMWVDHQKRTVVFETPATRSEMEEDRLDHEYRYWSFMEAHPAHTALPANARAEAMDALTWSYTDRLLPSQRQLPPPFAQEECQELTSLLRSFDGVVSVESSDNALQSIMHTRIVSRILLRVSRWRQARFRPERPLPRDVVDIRGFQRRVPFVRVVLDFVISCLCLGIPYIFMSRIQHQRVDEESGLRSAGPILVLGASACLIAAVVLSASVTLVSLPGVDSLGRVAGLVAILCATGTMVTFVIALLRYKLDMQEGLVLGAGAEGLTLLTRRAVLLSLPFVFLAYALGALVTGVVLYTGRLWAR